MIITELRCESTLAAMLSLLYWSYRHITMSSESCENTEICSVCGCFSAFSATHMSGGSRQHNQPNTHTARLPALSYQVF